MVDVVVNNVMATSLTPDLSTYFFKDAVCLGRVGNVLILAHNFLCSRYTILTVLSNGEIPPVNKTVGWGTPMFPFLMLIPRIPPWFLNMANG
jgi:hypothetical protein